MLITSVCVSPSEVCLVVLVGHVFRVLSTHFDSWNLSSSSFVGISDLLGEEYKGDFQFRHSLSIMSGVGLYRSHPLLGKSSQMTRQCTLIYEDSRISLRIISLISFWEKGKLCLVQLLFSVLSSLKFLAIQIVSGMGFLLKCIVGLMLNLQVLRYHCPSTSWRPDRLKTEGMWLAWYKSFSFHRLQRLKSRGKGYIQVPAISLSINELGRCLWQWGPIKQGFQLSLILPNSAEAFLCYK